MQEARIALKQIFWTNALLGVFAFVLAFSSCSRRNGSGGVENEVWVYTSLYKDTIDELEPALKRAFPKMQVHWVQGTPEEIAAKINAEIVAGGTKADVILTNDRLWFEELAEKEILQPFAPKQAQGLAANLRHPRDLYWVVSLPVMVLGYNVDVVPNPPKSFKELVDERWKGRISSGDPLASALSFTTMAFLQSRYGWDYFQKLKKNEILIEGSSSSAVRRLQTKEKPIGIALYENLERFKGDQRVKVMFPEDGVIFLSNTVGLVRRVEANRNAAESFVNWLFEKEAQAIFVRAYMYSPFENINPPEGAPPLAKLRENAFVWTPDFISAAVQERVRLKEKFAELLFKKPNE